MRAPAVLRLRDFRLLWSGQAISTLGDQLFPVAVTIAVLDSTRDDASAVGLILACRWLALVLFVMIGGVWADRLPRRVVMMGADVFRAVVVLALATVPHPPLWVLAGLVFLVGGGEAFFRPAYGALLPTVVPADRVAAANALTSMSFRTGAIIGPALSAAIVTSTGPRPAFALDALTFLVSLATLGRVAEPAHQPRERQHLVVDIREGFAEVWRQRWIATILALAAVQLMMVIGPTNVLLPVIGRREFHTDSVYALSLALMSVGGLLGAVASLRWKPRRRGLVGMVGLLMWMVVPLALLYPVHAWLIYAAYFAAGLGTEPFIVFWASALQEGVRRDMLARVTSLDWLCSFALMPVGLALTGPAAASLGESSILWAAVVVASIPTVLVLAVPGVARFRHPRPTGADSGGTPTLPVRPAPGTSS